MAHTVNIRKAPKDKRQRNKDRATLITRISAARLKITDADAMSILRRVEYKLSAREAERLKDMLTEADELLAKAMQALQRRLE